MKAAYLILCLALIAGSASAFNIFEKIQLNKTNGAMCMDGTNYAIYTYVSDASKPLNKLLIYFEEVWQNWCAKQDLNHSITRCHEYVNNSEFIDYGSSKNYASDCFFLEGLLKLGGNLSSWDQTIIKSCDGGAYFGDTSVKVKNGTLNFKGSRNVVQAINYLKKINFIQNRDQVMLVGIANGGLAALAWADYIKAQTNGKVRVLTDASIWENDLNDKTKDNYFEKRLQTMAKLFIGSGNFPNSKCQAAHPDAIEKCFYASELVKYVDPSIQILFLQSYYDGWAMAEILGLDCTEQFASLSECTEQHRQAIQSYHEKITGKMHEMVKLPNVDAFGISCVAHFFTNVRWDDENFSVPAQKNNTAINIVNRWLQNKSNQTYLDELPWPHNVPCSRKVILDKNLLSE